MNDISIKISVFFLNSSSDFNQKFAELIKSKSDSTISFFESENDFILKLATCKPDIVFIEDKYLFQENTDLINQIEILSIPFIIFITNHERFFALLNDSMLNLIPYSVKYKPIKYEEVLAEIIIYQKKKLRKNSGLLVVSESEGSPDYSIVDKTFYFLLNKEQKIINININSTTIVGKYISEVFPHNFTEQIIRSINLLTIKQKSIASEIETKLSNKDYWFQIILSDLAKSESDEVIYKIIIKDITERKILEKLLEESENRFKKFFKELQSGTIIFNDIDEPLIINQAFADYLGYTITELSNKPALEIIEKITYKEDYPKEYEFISEVLSGGENHYTFEKRYIKKDGSIVWGKIFSIFYHDKLKDKHIGVGVVIDTDEQHKNLYKLKNANKILEIISDMSSNFITTPNWKVEISDLLERLGEGTRSDRVYIFENSLNENNEILMSIKYEWTNDGVDKQINNPSLSKLSYAKSGYKRWENEFKKKKNIHGLIQSFPIDEKSLLADQEIKSILVVPIYVTEQWWGFIGFDQCEYERIWSRYEIQALELSAKIIGSAIQRTTVEDALQKLIYDSIHGILIRVNKKIVFSNPRMLEITGYSQNELIGLNELDFNKLIYPEDLQYVRWKLSLNFFGDFKTTKSEIRLIRKDGSLVWLEVTTSLIEYNGKKAHQDLFIDVTEQKYADSKLKESEKRLQVILENLSDISVYMIDKESKIIFAAGEEFEEFKLYSKLTEGKKLSEIIPHSVFSQINQFIQDALSGNTIQKEINISNSWFIVQASPIQSATNNNETIFVIHRINKQKNYEKMIVEKEQTLSAILKLLPDIGFIFDSFYRFKQEFTNNNSQLLLNPQNFIGRSILDVDLPDDLRKSTFEKLKYVFKTGGSTDFKYSLVIMNELKYFEARFEKMNNDNVLCLIRDITEIIQNEKFIRENELKIRKMLDNLSVGIFRTNHDGKIIYSNNAFRNIIAVDEFFDIKKINIKELFINEEEKNRLFNKLAEYCSLKNVDCQWKNLSKSILDVQISLNIMVDPIDSSYYIDGTVEDFTQVNKTQQKLKQYIEELRMQNKALERRITSIRDSEM